MKKEEKKEGESVKDSPDKEKIVQNDSVQKEAEASDTKQTTLTDASEVIGSSGDFKLPKISEFLGDKDNRTAVLSSARLVKGKFGMTTILDLEEKND